MKICYLVPSLRSSGPTNQLLYLVEENSLKARCTVIYLKNENVSEIHFTKLKALSINLKQLSFFNAIQYLFKEKFDIIHSQGLLADLIATLQYKSKSVLTSRNNPFKDYPSKFGFLKGTIMALSHWIIQLLNKNVISCSYALGDDLKKIGIKNKVIQNGTRVPLENFYLQKSVSELLTGISTGNLIPRKNFEYTFKLFSHLDTFKLDIYGKGSYQVDDYPKNVILKGYSNNVTDLYTNYDFFISTSFSEGLPNSVLEAAMNGLPLILSNISPHEEIAEVIPNCLIIDIDKDEKQNSLLISEYLNSIKTETRKNIAKNAQIHFSKQKMANNYFEYYNLKN
jgi:glycosyltransferase involved in cell wall biosynthesis